MALCCYKILCTCRNLAFIWALSNLNYVVSLNSKKTEKFRGWFLTTFYLRSRHWLQCLFLMTFSSCTLIQVTNICIFVRIQVATYLMLEIARQEYKITHWPFVHIWPKKKKKSICVQNLITMTVPVLPNKILFIRTCV